MRVPEITRTGCPGQHIRIGPFLDEMRTQIGGAQVRTAFNEPLQTIVIRLVTVLRPTARHRGLDLDCVEIHVITAPSLRLDRDPHRGQLMETARRLRPRLLLLDPLVRLHGLDMNHATEVAGLLAYFRLLQRKLNLSVILAHHTRKNTAGGVAAGQGLRGSSDLHAFGDSNLYLRRTRDRLVLSTEHRAAPASPPVYLELVADAQTTHLAFRAEVQVHKQRPVDHVGTWRSGSRADALG